MFKLYMCLTGSTLVILFPMDSPALRPQLCSRRCGRHPSRRMRSCPLKRELRACRSPRRPTSTRASCRRPVEQENNQSSTNQAAGRPPTPSSDCRGHVRKGGRGGWSPCWKEREPPFPSRPGTRRWQSSCWTSRRSNPCLRCRTLDL